MEPVTTGMLIAGGVSALSNIIGSMFSSKSSNASARAYLQGVENTNKTNLQLAHEQQDWDLAQWQRENEYNAAGSQLQRWQDAGFSPQSFIQVGDPGNAASLQSPDLANQVAPSEMSGYANVNAQSIMQGIKGASDAALSWQQMDLRQKELDIQKKQLANETAATEADVSYKNALSRETEANIDFIKAKTRMTDSQRYQFDSITELNWQRWQQLAKMFPLQYESQEIHNAISRLDRVFNESSIEQRIAKVAADLDWSISDTKLKLKQAMYWATQAEEGEFQISTQPLRYDLLNWQQQQVKFDLDFNKNTRYSQLRFENVMKAAHATYELGTLAVDVAGEVRAWIKPFNSHTHLNFNFKNGSFLP